MTVDLRNAIVLESHLGPARRSRATDAQQRLNSALAIVLVAIVALAPIPLGSNRPFFWGLWAGVLGLVAAIYAIALLTSGEPLRFSLRRLALPAMLTLGLAGFLVVQSLPFVSTTFTTGLGEPLTSNSLSIAPGSTWLMLLQWLTYALFFALMLQVCVNRARARTVGLALLFIITAYAAYGLVALTMLGDTLLVFEKWAYSGFATGTFVNRNSYATFLAFGLVLGVVFTGREIVTAGATHKGRLFWGKAPVYLACTGLILAALLASGSRMGLAAGILGSGAAVVMAMGKGAGRSRPGFMLLAVLPVILAVAVLVLYGASTMERLGSVENDANVRGDLYAQVMGMIVQRPWLGYGGGSFELAYPLYHVLPVSPDLVWDRAHSTYLSLWAELGLIAGSVPILLITLFAFEALWLYLRRSGDWAAPAAAVCVTLVAAIHSLVDFSLEMQANTLLFLAILAIGIARRPDVPAGEDDPKVGQ
jgi:O-antigen ligase